MLSYRGQCSKKKTKGGQSELKDMTALVGLKDENTAKLLTAAPSGRKTEILLNQMKCLAGQAMTLMFVLSLLCNFDVFSVCINVKPHKNLSGNKISWST